VPDQLHAAEAELTERFSASERAERAAIERFHVSAVSAGDAAATRRRGEAMTRALFDATANGQPARARFTALGDHRLLMRIDCARDVQAKTGRAGVPLDFSLAASGFAFISQAEAFDTGETQEMCELPPPAVVVCAAHWSRIGFNALPCRQSPTIILTPSLSSSGMDVDEALAVMNAAGVRGAFEMELTGTSLNADAIGALESLVAAGTKGAVRVLGRVGWDVPGPELLAAILGTARAWLAHPRGVRLSARVSASIPPSLGESMRRTLFTDDPSEAAVTDGTESRETPLIDLRGCVPGGATLLTVVPAKPEILRLIAPSRPMPPIESLPRDGVGVGVVAVGTTTADVRVTARDRQRHTMCVGSSGVGKSTMICRMIAADIAAGEGVCVIDPHGELIARVLERIPSRRIGDVLWLRPGMDGRTFGLNLLDRQTDATGRTPNVLCNELFRIFDRLYDMHMVAGPMFELYMRSAALLLVENTRPGGTLLDIVRLFEHDNFRDELVKTCTNPVIVDFWRTTATRTTGEASLRSLAPYITSKLNQFVTNASVRAIVAQPKSTIDFRDAMDRRAIVLLDLSVGTLGVSDVQLLGMLALGKLFAGALERVADASDAPPFHVYADEVHLFATDSLAEIVSQARKGNLSFVLATQSLSQLKTSRAGSRLLESVVGNVGTFVVFRVGPFDADLLEPLFRNSLSKADLEELPDFSAACKLLVNGVPLDPFVLQTQPLEGAQPDSARVIGTIRRKSRRYTRSIKDIGEEIANWSFRKGKELSA
jgi:hypothetical protein